MCFLSVIYHNITSRTLNTIGCAVMICKTLVFSDHAIDQMFKRAISVGDVKHVIETGE